MWNCFWKQTKEEIIDSPNTYKTAIVVWNVNGSAAANPSLILTAQYALIAIVSDPEGPVWLGAFKH